MALELKGDTDGAIAEYKKAIELNDDPSALAFLAHAEASIGHQEEARQLLAQLTEKRKRVTFSLTHLPWFISRLEKKIRRWIGWKKQCKAPVPLFFNFIKIDPFSIRCVAIQGSKRLCKRLRAGNHESRNFFTELKRRNVYKVAIAYAVVGWLLIQIATQVFPFFEIPNWGVRLMVLIIALGFPIALIIGLGF